jgi:hypothetical protein
MFFPTVFTFLLAGEYPTTNSSESESESELPCDLQFAANQFVLAPNPLKITTRDLNCPAYNISVRTAQKTPFFCCCSIIAQRTAQKTPLLCCIAIFALELRSCFLAEPLPSNRLLYSCLFHCHCLAGVYMPQYVDSCRYKRLRTFYKCVPRFICFWELHDPDLHYFKHTIFTYSIPTYTRVLPWSGPRWLISVKKAGSGKLQLITSVRRN